MARKREDSIRESNEDLQQLEEEHRGKPAAARVRALRMLRERPGQSIGEIAAAVGFSSATVKRWLKAYREGGLEELLEMRGGGRELSRSVNSLDRLKQKLLRDEFDSLEGVETWIRDYRRSLDTDRLAEYVTRSQANRVRRTSAGDTGTGDDSESSATTLPESIITRRMAEWPKDRHSTAWIRWLAHALEESFDDVERATLSVNLACDLINPKEYRPTIGMSYDSKRNELRIGASDVEESEDVTRVQRNLQVMEAGGFPIDTYHPPTVVVYKYEDSAYIGTLLLWRDRSKPPIGSGTLKALERLRPLLVFFMSDFVARHRLFNPEQFLYQDIMIRIGDRHGLTDQESRVLVMQIIGRGYREISESLRISINTVRSHIRAIYKKTGAHSPADLIAKYFSLIGNSQQ